MLRDHPIAVIENKALELGASTEPAVHLLRLFDCRLFIRRVNIATVLKHGLGLPYSRLKHI